MTFSSLLIFLSFWFTLTQSYGADPDLECQKNWKDGPNHVRGSEGQLLAIVTCKAGKRNGPYKGWYPDGTQRVDGNYQDGLRTGSWTRWHKDGKLRDRGQWLGGEAEGDWKFYGSDGKIIQEKKFCKGEDCANAGQRLRLLSFRAFAFYGTQPGRGYVYSGQVLWSPSFRISSSLTFSLQAGSTFYTSQSGTGIVPAIDAQGVLELTPGGSALVPFAGGGAQIMPTFSTSPTATGGVDYRFRHKFLGIIKGLTVAYTGIFANTAAGMIHIVKLGCLVTF